MKDKIVNQIIIALQTLSLNKQLIFVYLVVKRLSSSYYTFCSHNNWGSPIIFNDALNILRERITSGKGAETMVQSFLEKIEEIAPDTEEFSGDILATAALDACGVLYETFEFALDTETEHLENIISLSINAIQMYVEDVNGYDYNEANYDEQVYNNELMVNELITLHSIILKLTLRNNLDLNFIDILENKFKGSFCELLVPTTLTDEQEAITID